MSEDNTSQWMMQISPTGKLEIVSRSSPDVVAKVGNRVIAQDVKNALLIAAAPDLLAALDQLVKDFESEIHNKYDGTKALKERLAECDYARKAIAKARGES